MVRGVCPESSASSWYIHRCSTWEFHAQRKAAAAKVLEATGNALDVINAISNKEAVTDFNNDAVEAILSAFNDHVLKAINDEDRTDEIILHDLFRESV